MYISLGSIPNTGKRRKGRGEEEGEEEKGEEGEEEKLKLQRGSKFPPCSVIACVF